MRQHDILKAEEQELTDILREMASDEVIERIGFQSRLDDVQEAIAGLGSAKEAQRAQLTFRGEPVDGTRAIAAGFASHVTSLFNDAIAAISAARQDRLGYMGKIPGKQNNDLLISGVATGSFGFEFELSENQDAFAEENGQTPTENALDDLLKLFKLTAEGSDDELSEVVDEIHPRAVRKVANLLDYAAKQKAWCGLSYGEQSYKFRSLDQQEKATARVQQDNLKNSEEKLKGQFLGFLPNARMFEFQPENQTHEIKGRIGIEIESTETLNQWISKPVEVTLQAIQVGNATPKYRLVKESDIQAPHR